MQTFKIIMREEGFFSLYNSFGAKWMRMAPGSAITLFLYETFYSYLKAKF